MPSIRRPENAHLDPTPLYAVLGATDLAVERVRHAAANAAEAQAHLEAQIAKLQHDVEKAIAEFDPKTAFDPKTMQSAAQHAPARAAATAMSVAGKAEARYEELARRGRELFERVRSQAATSDLLAQGKNTIARTKGAATTVRKAADDTAAALIGTINVGKREATTVADSTATTVTTAVKTTRVSARKAADTAGKEAATAKSAVKGARTSAAKTASSAGKAAKATAKKVGD